MPKRKHETRSLVIEAPIGDVCPECKGSGWYRGAVSQLYCPECDGLGLVNLKQKYYLDMEDAKTSALIVARRENAELRRALAQHAKDQHIGSPFD